MIVYSLNCREGHGFEGWFASSDSYEEQRARGKLVCPVCNSRHVDKAPMAPSLAGTRKADPPAQELRKMRQFMTGLRKHIEENSEYVGPKFPEEARKIHYGETEERSIYGEATIGEAKDLVEEGIDVAPLPPDIGEAN